jgi:hypothetical protein
VTQRSPRPRSHVSRPAPVSMHASPSLPSRWQVSGWPQHTSPGPQAPAPLPQRSPAARRGTQSVVVADQVGRAGLVGRAVRRKALAGPAAVAVPIAVAAAALLADQAAAARGDEALEQATDFVGRAARARGGRQRVEACLQRTVAARGAARRDRRGDHWGPGAPLLDEVVDTLLLFAVLADQLDRRAALLPGARGLGERLDPREIAGIQAAVWGRRPSVARAGVARPTRLERQGVGAGAEQGEGRCEGTVLARRSRAPPAQLVGADVGRA